MRTIADTHESTALSPTKPDRRPAPPESPFEKLFSLGITLRLALRRARMRRAGLGPSPVRAMTEAERAAALRLLDE